MPDKPAIKVFLSHSYKAWPVNLYFFRLFEEMAEVQFDVDEGVTATNVTRLERVLRGCDAFIGIYGCDTESPALAPEQLSTASQYFRLELDLAVRSGKPTIVFSDQRYGALLRYPAPVRTVLFDSQEVEGSGGFPSAEKHRKAFLDFCEYVSVSRGYETLRGMNDRSTVGVLLPDSADGAGYSVAHRRVIEESLQQHGQDDIVSITLPSILSRRVRTLPNTVDWLVADVAVSGAAALTIAFLHACFVPMIRLARETDSESSPSELEATMFGEYEVGYVRDVVRWREEQELRSGLAARLAGLQAPVRRISTSEQAEEYFLSSAKRKESVFLSYAGPDADIAAEISAELKRRFQRVFDYRDGQSLKAGQAWLPSLFGQLSASAVGVLLLSQSYLASGHCRHEAEEMINLRDSNKMFVAPMKLGRDRLDLPTFLDSTQYLRLTDHPNGASLVSALIAALDEEG
jgi:hypothetical protein